jgi:S-adenosylmethionine:tRNA ribosyltransferase-isomerase
MRTDELDYELPSELIAQRPAERRDASRMLVLDRARQTMHVDVFTRLPEFLHGGDCLVLNDTRVIRARLKGVKPTGGAVEIFLLHEDAPGSWRALVRPSAKVRPGTPVEVAPGVRATVAAVLPNGQRQVHFEVPDVIDLLERIGSIPLPPYIHRNAPDANDLSRYQTVYAQQPGAVAAPTAGLHYSDAVFDALAAKGVDRTAVTLHVGYGTFKPVTADTLEEHRVDGEDFLVPEATAAKLNATRAAGGRVVAVGTTATRVLETCHHDGAYHAQQGVTTTYIYPPYTFNAVDVLQTNFHLPKSSLLALVCAFAGKDFVMEAYRYAVQQRFRFYSYGDVMLIL